MSLIEMTVVGHYYDVHAGDFDYCVELNAAGEPQSVIRKIPRPGKGPSNRTCWRSSQKPAQGEILAAIEAALKIHHAAKR